MKLKPIIIVLASFFCLATAQNKDWIFDFANKGYDFDQAIPPTGWKGVNRCGEPDLQSPINLLTPLGIYGWIYGKPIPVELTNFEANYLDPKPNTKIVYERKNFKMFLNEIDPRLEGQETYVRSDVFKDLYGCSTNKFVPTSFHLHSPAEHPINGFHNDIALHIAHYLQFEEAQTKTFAAIAVAIQFSVDEYDRSISQEEIRYISEFFDSLQLGGLSSNQIDFGVDQIPFQRFMEVIDLEHVWVYQGSGGFPPCVKKVGWMLSQQIYPMEFKHKFLIRKVYLDNQDELKSTSNIRGIHPVNGHDVYVIGQARLVVGTAFLFAGTLLLYL